MATSIGLALATATSVVNVMTDVCRKKAVNKNDIIGTWFWISTVAGLVFLATFGYRMVAGAGPVLQPTGALFVHLMGGFGANWPPVWKFVFCLLIDGGLETAGLYFYLRALQLSDLSISVPFLAFTPVLLIPTGYLFLHEVPEFRQLLGVVLVVCGSIAMNKEAFRNGWLGPLRAILEEPGSRYMLMVSVCFAVTNPMDKMIVLMSDPVTAGCGYGIVVWLFYAGLMLLQRKEWGQSIRHAPKWIVLSGILYAVTQLLQFTSHHYIDVVLTITIKRAGIILSVLTGWLIFREKHIEDRLAASIAMLCGVILIYLPISERTQLALTAVVVVLLTFSLRRRHASHAG